MDEIKEWKADNYRSKVCGYLMLQNIPFSFSEESGLVFTAPSFFVEKWCTVSKCLMAVQKSRL